jgi:hypothetical protein
VSAVGSECRSYYFQFTSASGGVYRYPETGYFNTYGEGSCTTDWTDTPRTPPSPSPPRRPRSPNISIPSVLIGSVGGGAISTVGTTVATVPGPPQDVAVSDVTSSSATISWSAPATDGGSAVTDYTIYIRLYGTEFSTTSASAGSVTFNCTISSLVI